MTTATPHIGREGLLNITRDDLHQVKAAGVKAALLGIRNAPAIHYTWDPPRWDGINKRLDGARGEFPRYADCSSYATWVIWSALRQLGRHARDLPDFVNGQSWKAGDTGSMVQHGRKVSLSDLRLLDLVFYGDEGWRPGHVAIYIGNGRVASHGSEGGPYNLPVRYRTDVGLWAPRRYLH